MAVILSRFLTLVFILSLASCGKQRETESNAIPLSMFAGGVELDASTKTPTSATKEYTPGSKLLTTQWNQLAPYNKKLSPIDGGTPVVGCVATAMAQIIRFHRPQVIFARNLTPFKKKNPVIRSTPYMWNAFTENPSLTAGTLEEEEIQSLMSDFAYAAKANFGIDGTSASNRDAISALRHFGLKGKRNATSLISFAMDDEGRMTVNVNEEAKKTVIREIKNRRPIYLSLEGQSFKDVKISKDGSLLTSIIYNPDRFSALKNPRIEAFDHAAVIDGYKYDDEGRFLVHINWGWGGSKDGFYDISKPIKVEGNDLGDNEEKVSQTKVMGIGDIANGPMTAKKIRSVTLSYIPNLTIYTGITPCQNKEDCYPVKKVTTPDIYDAKSGRLLGNPASFHEKYLIGRFNIKGKLRVESHKAGTYLFFYHHETRKNYSYKIIANDYPKRRGAKRLEVALGETSIYYGLTKNENERFNTLSKLDILFTVNGKVMPLVKAPKTVNVKNMSRLIKSPYSLYEGSYFEIPVQGNIAPHLSFKILASNQENISLKGRYLDLSSVDKKGLSSVEVGLFEVYDKKEILVDKHLFHLKKKMHSIIVPFPRGSYTSLLSKTSPRVAKKGTKIYLKGKCTISADRGFSNAAMYINISSNKKLNITHFHYNKKGELTTPNGVVVDSIKGSDEKITAVFEEGVYQIDHYAGGYDISLNLRFTVTANCDPGNRPNEKEVLRLKGIDMSLFPKAVDLEFRSSTEYEVYDPTKEILIQKEEEDDGKESDLSQEDNESPPSENEDQGTKNEETQEINKGPHTEGEDSTLQGSEENIDPDQTSKSTEEGEQEGEIENEKDRKAQEFIDLLLEGV